MTEISHVFKAAFVLRNIFLIVFLSPAINELLLIIIIIIIVIIIIIILIVIIITIMIIIIIITQF